MVDDLSNDTTTMKRCSKTVVVVQSKQAPFGWVSDALSASMIMRPIGEEFYSQYIWRSIIGGICYKFQMTLAIVFASIQDFGTPFEAHGSAAYSSPESWPPHSHTFLLLKILQYKVYSVCIMYRCMRPLPSNHLNVHINVYVIWCNYHYYARK